MHKAVEMHNSLQSIFDKLDADLINLLEDLKDQPDHVLNEKLSPDKWSIHQTMYHLILAEELSLKYVQKKLSFNPELKNTGIMTFFRRTALNLYFLYPFRVKAPAAISNENLPTEVRFWEVVQKWKDVRKETKEYLASLPEDLLKKEIYKHPAIGRLSLKDMLKFYDLHFTRHRKQINRTMSKVQYVV